MPKFRLISIVVLIALFLQAMHTGRSKQFICEAGLVGYFGWKRVAGSGNFTITIDTVAKDADSVPR